MTTKSLKLSGKLDRVGESFTVSMYDNGFMVEISGRDKRGDYKSIKMVCNTLEEVLGLVTEAAAMERAD
jgi:hypothetical protein